MKQQKERKQHNKTQRKQNTINRPINPKPQQSGFLISFDHAREDWAPMVPHTEFSSHTNNDLDEFIFQISERYAHMDEDIRADIISGALLLHQDLRGNAFNPFMTKKKKQIAEQLRVEE